MATINGDGGPNDLDGGVDADTINGFDGNDTLDGFGGDDIIDGGANNDFITGGDGDDDIDGGSGFDTANWSDRLQSFTFNLNAFTNSAVSADMMETDSFERIEGIFGTNFGDTYNATAGFQADDGLFVSLRLGAGNDVINNTGALVRVDYRSAIDDVTINLTTGVGQSTGAGDAAGVGVDMLNGVHRVRGSDFDDTITGSDSGTLFEQFEGRNGADTIDGGGGTQNEARYRFSPSGIDVDLAAGTADDGTGSTDTLIGIQRIEGTDHDDIIAGDAANNVFRSRSGADQLTGLAGDDRLEGASGEDMLDGGEGNDILRPGSGDDTGDGGLGLDRLDYSTDGSGAVTFVFGAMQTAVGANIGSDTFTGVERGRGGGGDDMFTVQNGYSGNLEILDQNGLLFNTFEGNAGDDTVVGNGATRLEFFSATGGITVDLDAGTATGDASVGSDTFSGVNGVAATGFNDTIHGSDGILLTGSRYSAEFFRLGEGDDFLDGRGGIDVVAYDFINNDVGIVADLAVGTITDGFGDTDTIMNVEGLAGGDLDDTLSGDTGDNILRPGGGDDMIDGRDGIDLVLYNTQDAGVTVNLAMGTADDGEGGTDMLSNIENAEGSVFADQLTGDGGANLLLGRSGGDTLNGGGGDDVLDGGAGHDDLNGGDGVDTVDYSVDPGAVTVNLGAGGALDGGGHMDSLTSIEAAIGSRFADNLIGGDTANTLEGRDGADIIIGGAGDDILRGGLGADNLAGGDGMDIASYVDSTVRVVVNLTSGYRIGGEAAGDTYNSIEGLRGSALNDTLVGTADANMLMGDEGRDTLRGEAGDDVLEGGAGFDRLMGGAGFDIASYTESAARVVINLGSGFRTGGDASGDTFNSIEGLEGSALNDILVGTGATNRLFGRDGRDTLRGEGGDDTLEGGVGFDTLMGGAGTDIASYADSAARVVINLGTGFRTGGDAAGDRYFDIEGLEGSAHNDILVGTATANQLLGRDGGDTLRGEGGDDILEGGAGSDALVGGAGSDIASYAGSDARVVVNLAVNFRSGGDAAGDSYNSIEGLEGSAFNDILVGTAGANTLIGGAGDDILRGGASGDMLVGGDGVDTASYTGSAARVVINLGTGFRSGGDAAGDTFNGIENLQGSALNDILVGTDGDNVLMGAAGADTLRGEAGSDVLIGGGGSDTFVIGQNFDTAEIRDFADGVDQVSLTAYGFSDFMTDVAPLLTTINGDAAIDFLSMGNDEVVVFTGVNVGQLDQTDFVL